MGLKSLHQNKKITNKTKSRSSNLKKRTSIGPLFFLTENNGRGRSCKRVPTKLVYFQEISQTL